MAWPLRLEYTAQPGNVPLYQVQRIPGRHLPYGVDHLLPTDRPTRLQRQNG
jgi:hypothetical protein